MHKNFFKFNCLSVLILLVAACGGSSGGSDDNLNVTGIWSGALTKVSDTCTPANPQTINFTHNVDQNESAVTLTSNNGQEYLGNIVGDNGFSVDANRNVTVGGVTCTEDSRIEYDQISDDNDPTGDVQISTTINCQGNGDCVSTYEGTASRSTAQPNPTATPNQTPQPGQTATPVPPNAITGGCADINESPANDTYEGDGSCGISDAAFRFEQLATEGVVTLEPFGENGLTTFVVSPANTSTATSRRSDLTINGEVGYVCSMTCSPTATFTVRCVKEGGSSCVEKF